MLDLIIVVQCFEKVILLGVCCPALVKDIMAIMWKRNSRSGRHFSLFAVLNLTMSSRVWTDTSSNDSINLGMQMCLNSQSVLLLLEQSSQCNSADLSSRTPLTRDGHDSRFAVHCQGGCFFQFHGVFQHATLFFQP